MTGFPVPDPTPSISAWFAAEVRRYREKAGWSQADLAQRLFCSEPKVGHLETGYRTPADVETCRALDRAFGLDRHFEGMCPLIKREQLPDMLWKFIEAETEAADIKVYETQVIPGLLQVETYACEVFRAGYAKRLVDERLATRLERQRILDRKTPPRLLVVIDEPALRRTELPFGFWVSLSGLGATATYACGDRLCIVRSQISAADAAISTKTSTTCESCGTGSHIIVRSIGDTSLLTTT